MVQISPDNGVYGWDWCSGYHYSRPDIVYFSHKHLNGTGATDLGDIGMMPYIRESMPLGTPMTMLTNMHGQGIMP